MFRLCLGVFYLGWAAVGLVLITRAADGPAAYVSGHIPSKVRKLQQQHQESQAMVLGGLKAALWQDEKGDLASVCFSGGVSQS